MKKGFTLIELLAVIVVLAIILLIAVKTSTTGTIYGVYDMLSITSSYVAAYASNENTNLTTYGSSILNSDSKYKNIYNKSGYEYNDYNWWVGVLTKGGCNL